MWEVRLGQAGNFNNFLTEAHCEQFCARIVCDFGTPLLDADGERHKVCADDRTCPTSHTCQRFDSFID